MCRSGPTCSASFVSAMPNAGFLSHCSYSRSEDSVLELTGAREGFVVHNGANVKLSLTKRQGPSGKYILVLV